MKPHLKQEFKGGCQLCIYIEERPGFAAVLIDLGDEESRTTSGVLP